MHTHPNTHTSDPTRHSNLAHIKRSLLALALMQVFAPTHANPSGMAVAAGGAMQSNPNANTLQLVTLPGTILNWQAFSIARGETTRFVQEASTSTVLNRVVGANPSSILGTLQSNGRVFLVNPNGIVFGGNSVVDTAGLIASTRELSDANFTAGNYAFSGSGNGDITLQAGAAMTTATYSGTGGGQIWLIAKNITTEAGSSITVPSGQVVLAAGNQVDVGTDSFGKMSFTLTTDGTNTLNSLGTIAADRGAVGLFADFINHRGTLNVGSQGSVSMDATNELRIQGTSEINALDGSITLRGGSVLEVEYESIINADGTNGRISFESNNLLVYPSGNAHAENGQVIFNQYQPSQYTEGPVQYQWVTPNNFTDDTLIVFRRNDGNYAVRFSRYNFTTSGNEVMEVVLDGRTHAVLSGPTAINSGLSDALNAANANASALSRAASDFYNNVLEPQYAAAISNVLADDPARDRIIAAARANRDRQDAASWVPAHAAQATAEAAAAAYYAGIPGGATAYYVNPNTTTVVRPAVLVGAGVSIGGGGIAPLTDGTYISNNQVQTLNAPLGSNSMNNVLLPGWYGEVVFAPNALGGFSALALGDKSLLTFTKSVPAYTPANSVTGAAGIASAFAVRAGAANSTGLPTPSLTPDEAARAAAERAEAARIAADRAAADQAAADRALAAARAAAAQAAADQAAAQASAAQAAAQLAAEQAAAAQLAANQAAAAQAAAAQAAAQLAAAQAMALAESARVAQAAALAAAQAAADQAAVNRMISADADRTAAASNTTQNNPFSRIPSCNSACGQMASNALTRVDSALMSDAMDRLASAEDARAVLDRVADQMEAEFMAQAQASDDASVRALMDASMAQARRDAINAFLQAKAGSIKDANMASNLMKDAQLLADNAAGGQINAFDAAAAARALRQYVAASRKEREMQLAAGMPVATQLDAYLKDNGDLRRLVNGSRLDQMTVDQRVVAITRWLQEEERNQQQGTGLNARDPNAVTMANMVSHMSEQELITWANKVAREQAGGSNP